MSQTIPSGMTTDRSLVQTGSDDRARVSAMLARAFSDDPAMSFIFPDRAVRLRKMPALFALMYDSDMANGVGLLTPGGEATTLWRAPGKAHTGTRELLRQAVPLVMTLGTALGRALAVSNAMDAHKPEGDYWYLHVAGCDPMHQGKGMGGAAIQGGLEQLAGGRYPAYLETATESNLGLYRHYGFEITEEWTVPNGGPTFWGMWRDA